MCRVAFYECVVRHDDPLYQTKQRSASIVEPRRIKLASNLANIMQQTAPPLRANDGLNSLSLLQATYVFYLMMQAQDEDETETDGKMNFWQYRASLHPSARLLQNSSNLRTSKSDV